MELFDIKCVYMDWDDELAGKKVFLGPTLHILRNIVNRGDVSLLQYTSKHPLDKGFVCEGEQIKGGYPDRYFPLAYYDRLYEVKLAYQQGKIIQCKKIQIRHTPDCEWIDLEREEPKWHSCYEYRVKPEEPAVISEMWTTCINDEGVVSVMPAREWNKSKGRQLIEGTEEECKDYAVENYCKKCVHEVSICCSPRLGCQGFRELKSVKKRRKTNRELAQWIAQGNGQMKHRDGNYILNTFNVYDIHDDDTPCPDYLVIRGWDETEWHEPLIEE